jgi:hypothetical protein
MPLVNFDVGSVIVRMKRQLSLRQKDILCVLSHVFWPLLHEGLLEDCLFIEVDLLCVLELTCA